jgi:molybdate transport system substrate-binding protein
MEGKMKKRLPILICLSILTCILLLASTISCGNSGPSSQSSSNITPAPGETSISQVYSSPPSARELLVFAAAGTKPAIDEDSRLFEQEYGTKITINYGGGGEVLSSMIIAKKGDLYISPEQRFMDSAEKQGAIASTVAPSTVAYMIPVIGVKKGNPQNIQSLADLAKPGIKIVVGNPETTALGIIAPEILQKAGLYDAVKPHIITNAPQVNAIITMLKMSQVDAGIIWHYFGVTSEKDVDIVWIPREYVTGIGEIQAAVSAFSQESDTAGRFVDFLTSPEVKDIFKKNGYIVDQQETFRYWLAKQ